MEIQLDEINSVREKLQGSEVNLKKELRVCIPDFHTLNSICACVCIVITLYCISAQLAFRTGIPYSVKRGDSKSFDVATGLPKPYSIIIPCLEFCMGSGEHLIRLSLTAGDKIGIKSSS